MSLSEKCAGGEDADATYATLCTHARESALIASVQSLLEWDERTKIPPAGGDYRAEQVAYLAAQLHAHRTRPEVGEWLDRLASSDLAAANGSDAATVIRQLRRQYDRQVKLPSALVEELARLTVLGQQAWATAREQQDYRGFQPILDRIIRLKREEAEAVGYEQNLYDALLDDFEPTATSAEVTAIFSELRDELVPFVREVVAADRRPPTEILTRRYPIERQRQFGTSVADAIGFDFGAGRLDVTDHPFCTTLGPRDVRITTRYRERQLPSALFGILHEAGHGIYEQQLRSEQFGLPPGEAISLGIHESQSRLWENLVGRSLPFWRHFFPQAQQHFSPQLDNVTVDDFYFAINDVQPSLIRVEADEVTYNLHVFVRYELELALLADDLSVDELPAAWNDKYREYLGVEPPNDAEGVLQDVHWSAGLFGYFPTYALGNLYAAQFFAAAQTELADLDDQFANGDFTALREWLGQRIHRVGQSRTASQLVQEVTGEPLSHRALMDQLYGKFCPLFDLARPTNGRSPPA